MRLADGDVVRARHAVLADVPAPALYRDLVGPGHLPPRFLDDVRRFEWDDATLKVNWALDAPIPWTAPGARRAGTVHLGVDDDGLVDVAADLAVGRMPASPFMLLGQMTTADPTRSPEGTESVVGLHPPAAPAGSADEGARRPQVERMEEAVERVAPGFLATRRARQVQTPRGLQDADGSLSRGALNAGTAALHQQLVLRPTRGPRASGDAGAGPLPRRRLGPPRWWGARRLRVERRGLRPAAPRAAPGGAPRHGPHRLVAGAARPATERRLELGAQVVARAAT